MNQSIKHGIALASMAAIVMLTTGCGTVTAFTGNTASVVTDDAIEKNTSMALGIPKGSFTIFDRVNEGIKASYSVKTKNGKQYNCYVTGSPSGVFGNSVVTSDALCTEMRADGRPSSKTGSASGQCNALLKAAGRC
ncbi:MAG: hypothetical protein LBE78_09435 [Burkholderiaceae bacterium]|nr:hypothetical protein [Burkholderiaceae bacterium]